MSRRRFACPGWDKSRLSVEMVSEDAYEHGEDSLLISISEPTTLVTDGGSLVLAAKGNATMDTMLRLEDARRLRDWLGTVLG